MNILFLTDGQFADIMCLVPVCKSLKDSGHDISLVYNDNGTARLFKLFLDDYKFFDYVNSFSKKKAKTGDRFIQWMTHSNFDIVVANKEKFRWVLPYVRSEIRYLKEYDGIHFTDNTFRLLGDLIDNKEPSVPCPIKSVKKRIFDKTNYKDQKFLAIAPTFTKTGSGYQHHWGTENYVNFINSLSYDWKPILIDRDDGISLCNQINFLTHKRCLNLAGCLTLSEMS